MIHSKTLDTGVVLQVGFVTDNLDRTAQWFAELLGVELPPVIPSAPPEVAQVKYKGEPTDAMIRTRHFRFENIDLELIEPDHEPSSWREFLDRRGPGVHHIAFQTRNIAAKTEALAQHGFPVLHKGEWVGGRYAYFDTEPRLGALLELLEFDRDKE